MMESRTLVVNLNHSKYDVYIGRAGHGLDGPFGNPCRVGSRCPECGVYHEERGSTIECFRKYFHRRVEQDMPFLETVLALKGKRLGCFCYPRRCHGDIISAYLDSR